MFKLRPDETIDEFFIRIKCELKDRFPDASLWLVEQSGKRFSYVKGDISNAFNPLKIKISDKFWIFISDKNTDQLQKNFH